MVRLKSEGGVRGKAARAARASRPTGNPISNFRVVPAFSAPESIAPAKSLCVSGEDKANPAAPEESAVHPKPGPREHSTTRTPTTLMDPDLTPRRGTGAPAVVPPGGGRGGLASQPRGLPRTTRPSLPPTPKPLDPLPSYVSQIKVPHTPHAPLRRPSAQGPGCGPGISRRRLTTSRVCSGTRRNGTRIEERSVMKDPLWAVER